MLGLSPDLVRGESMKTNQCVFRKWLRILVERQGLFGTFLDRYRENAYRFASLFVNMNFPGVGG